MKINRHYTKLLLLVVTSSIFVLVYSTVRQIYLSRNAVSPSDLLRLQLDLSRSTLNDNQIISNIKMIKCNRLLSCQVPDGYTILNPALNHHLESGKKIYDWDVHVIVKMAKLEEATKYISDISLQKKDGYELVTCSKKGSKNNNSSNNNNNDNNDNNDNDGDGDGDEDNDSLMSTTATNFKFYKQIKVTNTENPIKDDQQVLRGFDILFGSNDLVDSRKYHQSLHLTSHESIHPILSISMMSNNDVADHKRDMKQKDENMGKLTTTSEKYKIMQLSDLHFGQDLGHCDSNGNICKSSDLKTLKFVEAALKLEEPELVVITGDLIDVDRSLDYKSVILKSLQPVLAAGVKFVYTFGDEVSSASSEIKKNIIEFFASLPNCLNTVPNADAEHLNGLSNYDFRITHTDLHQTVEVSVLDSQGHLIDESQINYLYRLNNQDTKADYKLLFFHHPLPQFRPEGVFKIIGSYNEKHPMQTATSAKFHDDIINCGYHVVSVGHEHENDACIFSELSKTAKTGGGNDDAGKSMWLCYNSITGDSGITKLNEEYVRKLRMFEADFSKQRLLSWKRKEDDQSAFETQLIYQKDV
ncbi:uncharacterized protein LODBEIA_P55730 [Lodderomyces beijingensis]|uniref:Calcineurin-like phosphoesterase domain-containing protein n=1 Tax=Lodderomyces beijingensis TaxID=1775926 RepID=A0ABP0ZT85_9ASCO